MSRSNWDIWDSSEKDHWTNDYMDIAYKEAIKRYKEAITPADRFKYYLLEMTIQSGISPVLYTGTWNEFLNANLWFKRSTIPNFEEKYGFGFYNVYNPEAPPIKSGTAGIISFKEWIIQNKLKSGVIGAVTILLIAYILTKLTNS